MIREVVESGRKEYKTTIPKSSVHSKETSIKERMLKERSYGYLPRENSILKNYPTDVCRICGPKYTIIERNNDKNKLN